MNKKLWWSSSSGRIELQITLDQAHIAHHPGQCLGDVQALLQEPEISAQLRSLDPGLIRSELQEYGAWSDLELLDHSSNLERLLWIACGDITEEQFLQDEESSS